MPSFAKGQDRFERSPLVIPTVKYYLKINDIWSLSYMSWSKGMLNKLETW